MILITAIVVTAPVSLPAVALVVGATTTTGAALTYGYADEKQIVKGILFYKNTNKVSLKDKKFHTVIGTIESSRNNPRDFEIEIIEDNIVYRIVTVYKSGFNKDSFEKNVKIGDKIELICSDYLGNTIFENNKMTQASVYSVKVNEKYYLTLETSFKINEKNSDKD